MFIADPDFSIPDPGFRVKKAKNFQIRIRNIAASVVDPDPDLIWILDPNPGGQKLPRKKENG